MLCGTIDESSLAMMGENPPAAIATAIENPSALTLEETRVLDAYYQYWTLFEVRNIVMHAREMTVSPAKTSSGFRRPPDAPLRSFGAGSALRKNLEKGFDISLFSRDVGAR